MITFYNVAVLRTVQTLHFKKWFLYLSPAPVLSFSYVKWCRLPMGKLTWPLLRRLVFCTTKWCISSVGIWFWLRINCGLPWRMEGVLLACWLSADDVLIADVVLRCRSGHSHYNWPLRCWERWEDWVRNQKQPMWVMLYPVIPLLQHLLPKFLRQDVYIIQNLLAISDAVTILVGITKASVFFYGSVFNYLCKCL